MKLRLEELEQRDAPATISGGWFVDALPVPGQYVYLAAGPQAEQILPLADAVTDAAGQYSFEVPPGVYSIWRPWQDATTPNSYTVVVGTENIFGLDFASVLQGSGYQAWLAGYQAAFGPQPADVNWWPGQAEYQAAQDAKAFWDTLSEPF